MPVVDYSGRGQRCGGLGWRGLNTPPLTTTKISSAKLCTVSVWCAIGKSRLQSVEGNFSLCTLSYSAVRSADSESCMEASVDRRLTKGVPSTRLEWHPPIRFACCLDRYT